MSARRQKGFPMDPEQKEALLNGAKLMSAWTAVGITSWADAASAAAMFYTCLLATEFIWKKVVRPLWAWWRFNQGAKR